MSWTNDPDVLLIIGTYSAAILLFVIIKIVSRKPPPPGPSSDKLRLIATLNAAGPSRRWFGADALAAIGIDAPNRAIHLARNTDQKARIIPFSGLLAAELIEDGATTIKTSSSRSIGGALIGGALLGPAGMVVGGLGASTTGRQLRDVHAIDVVITILDMEHPRFVLRVLDAPHGLRTESESYRAARRDAEELLGVLKVAIETADREAQAAQPEPARAAASIADELEKLASLRERGILTEEEFQTRKAATLAT